MDLHSEMILNEYRKDIIENNAKCRGTKIRIMKKIRHIRSIIAVFKSDIKKVITLVMSWISRVKPSVRKNNLIIHRISTTIPSRQKNRIRFLEVFEKLISLIFLTILYNMTTIIS